MRDAPSIALVQALNDTGAHVRAYDPGMEQARKSWTSPSNSPTVPMIASGVRMPLALVTEWQSFRALDLDRMRQAMADPILVDFATSTDRGNEGGRVHLSEHRTAGRAAVKTAGALALSYAERLSEYADAIATRG